MATAPYRFIDRRGTDYFTSGSNQLHQAASTSDERVAPPELGRDTFKNVSELGRRTLMSISRKLFGDFPALESTVKEQANLAVGTFLPQFYGRNRTWGKLAESWLVDEWLPICDMRGAPYDGDTYLELHVISELRDGDMGTLLTETSQGYPAIQIIPAHRIRSPLSAKAAKVRLYQRQMWVDGIQIDDNRPYLYEDPIEWDAPVCGGVILGPFGNALAYRIYDDSLFDYGTYRDVPARGLALNFHPVWADQARGLPAVGSGAWDWQDVKESRRFDLMAQKVASAIYACETNESGQATVQSLARAAVWTEGTPGDTPATMTSPAVQDIKGGIKYFRTGSGGKIEFPTIARPSQQVQQFQESVIRDAMSGIEWNYIFGVDPSKAGGASLRIVVDRINRVLEKRRKSPAKSFKRVIGYAIAKAMDIGVLPWDDDWWMWEFQGPARMTADKKYDSDVDISEIEAGLSTNKIACARRGEYWEDIDEQTAVEKSSRIAKAKRVAGEHGITWQEAYALMWPPKASAAKVQVEASDSTEAEQTQSERRPAPATQEDE